MVMMIYERKPGESSVIDKEDGTFALPRPDHQFDPVIEEDFDEHRAISEEMMAGFTHPATFRRNIGTSVTHPDESDVLEKSNPSQFDDTGES
jgi:hypothetical protein